MGVGLSCSPVQTAAHKIWIPSSILDNLGSVRGNIFEAATTLSDVRSDCLLGWVHVQEQAKEIIKESGWFVNKLLGRGTFGQVFSINGGYKVCG